MSAGVSLARTGDDSAPTAADMERDHLEVADKTQVLRGLARVSLIVLMLLATAVGPAAAQTQNPLCQNSAQTLANMIEGFLQISVSLGLMGLLVVWQADSLMSMFRMPREERSRLKQHRRSAGKSAVTLVMLGPLFAVAGSAMDLPIARCVDLIPF